MFNHELGLGFIMHFENHILDKFIQWKNLSKGQYVMGFEPATNYVDGKTKERTRDIIKKIPPQESIKHKIILQFFDDREEYLKTINISQ